ncbi:MAG TPA: dephospho-CoA kinase [Actinomycetota bacterium]|nr:dephospho-CoA kinase [Actinomycetota bacterium]
MILIGLSGGIGSGKSTAARLLEARGAVVLDADLLAHEILAPGGAAVGAVLQRFGPGVAGPDGGIDRRRLRSLVFADPAARRDLEAITHPLIYAAMASRLGGTFEQDTVVVVDAPLLVETGGRDRVGMQALVVVAAEQSQQIERVVARGGMTAEEAAAVIAAQAPAERKLAAADYVLDNRSGLADLEAGVETLWAELRERFGSRSARG